MNLHGSLFCYFFKYQADPSKIQSNPPPAPQKAEVSKQIVPNSTSSSEVSDTLAPKECLSSTRNPSTGSAQHNRNLSETTKLSEGEATQPRRTTTAQRPPPGWRMLNNNAKEPVTLPKGPQRMQRPVLRPPPGTNLTFSISNTARNTPGGQKGNMVQGVAKLKASNLRQPTPLTKLSSAQTSRLQQPKKYGGLP